MNERSLHLSPEGIEQANLALAAKNMTTERLALELKLASMYVNKFFRGEAIPTQMFAQVCEGLGLNWQELFSRSSSAPSVAVSLDNTVQEVKQKCYENLTKRCNRIRVLEMREPRELKEIYTNINIVEELGQVRERLSLLSDRFNERGNTSILTKIGDRLKRDANSEDLDQYISRVTVKSSPALQGIKEFSKLIILGGVGAGKTTLLKYLALQCLNGNFHGELVPVLISLADFSFSDQSLSNYIISTISSYGCKETHHIEQLLNQGSLLVLLDGLDEVSSDRINRVISQIKHLSDQFYRNHILITGRVCDYQFEQFSEVQIAKFNEDQVQTFVRQWFNSKDMVKNFKNAIAEHLTLKELTENPLLLTFLCLIFESNSFLNPIEILEQSLDLYLDIWDSDRQIPTRKLSPQIHIWSHVALMLLDAGKYAFKPKLLSKYLASALQSANPQNLDDSELKSIVRSGLLIPRQKDMYAFAHKGFQEYLAALKIAKSANPAALNYLSDRLEDRRWQNVMVLAMGLSANADDLLIKLYKKANQILEKQQKLQEFLDWINKNSTYLRVSYQPATLRAFYLDMGLNNFRIQDRNRAVEFTRNRALDRVKERGDTTASLSETSINADYDLAIALNLDLALYIANNPVLQLAGLLEPQLRKSLQTSKEKLPNPQLDQQKFDTWWEINGINWSKDCRSLLIQHRKTTQEWDFSPEEEALIKRYHDAHIVIVNCLNMGSISTELRQSIWDTMFLPIWQQL